jgi:formylglycine-generating enzyme required for sulfatase activity
MCYVPPGSFQRDGTATNISTITKGYWMGETEVTQELWYTTGLRISPYYGAKLPACSLSWYHTLEFCNRLSLATGKTPAYNIIADNFGDWTTYSASIIVGANGYRLPTSMEWMWAAMGADTTEQPNRTGYKKGYPGSTGTSTTGLSDYGWYKQNSGNTSHTVATKKPNELGLYDMLGNVWEWCWEIILRGGGYAHSGLNRITETLSINSTSEADMGYDYVGFRIVLPFN